MFYTNRLTVLLDSSHNQAYESASSRSFSEPDYSGTSPKYHDRHSASSYDSSADSGSWHEGSEYDRLPICSSIRDDGSLHLGNLTERVTRS